jgi:uracil-DNA glycosylase
MKMTKHLWPGPIDWTELQQEIRECRQCATASLSEVHCPDARIPVMEPRTVKLLFISEAPPLKNHCYFYYEAANDRLRERVFGILRELGYEISTIQDFCNAGFYLLPTVKCASAKGGRNSAPSGRVIALCAGAHLRREIEHIQPEGILLLGRTALHGFLYLCELWEVELPPLLSKRGTVTDVAGTLLKLQLGGKAITVMPSYWPTRRHRKYHEIGLHIRQLMAELDRAKRL